MLKGKISLQTFAGIISQSITKANEMLQTNHREAVMRVINDERGVLMPPPTPLMIQNVKVKFRANVSRSEYERDSSDLLIDLSKPDGNFSGEFEFVPFSPDMLRSAKSGDRRRGQNPEHPARPAPPTPHMSRPSRQSMQPLMSEPEPEYMQQDEEQPLYPQDDMGREEYDESDMPANANSDDRRVGHNTERHARHTHPQSRHGNRQIRQDDMASVAYDESDTPRNYSFDD